MPILKPAALIFQKQPQTKLQPFSTDPTPLPNHLPMTPCILYISQKKPRLNTKDEYRFRKLISKIYKFPFYALLDTPVSLKFRFPSLIIHILSNFVNHFYLLMRFCFCYLYNNLLRMYTICSPKICQLIKFLIFKCS